MPNAHAKKGLPRSSRHSSLALLAQSILQVTITYASACHAAPGRSGGPPGCSLPAAV